MKNTILQLIAAEANCPINQIQLDNTLEEDLGLDSMSLTLLLMNFEDDLDVSIPDEQWQRCRTVQDIIILAGEQMATH